MPGYAVTAGVMFSLLTLARARSREAVHDYRSRLSRSDRCGTLMGMADPRRFLLVAALALSACSAPVPTPVQAPAGGASPTLTTASVPARRTEPAGGDIAATRLATGEGYVWAVTSGRVQRLDLKTGEVIGDPIAVGFQVEAIAVGGGAVWVANQPNGNVGPVREHLVARIDAAGLRVSASATVSPNPSGMAYGWGSLWVGDYVGTTVTRFNSDLQPIAKITVGQSPIALAAGEGAIWVANHDGRSVSRIDPETNRVTTIAIAEEPHRIAVGAGAVWVSNFHVNSVTRIDPRTNTVSGEAIPIGYAAGAIAADGHSVWVTSDYRARPDHPNDVVVIGVDARERRVDSVTPVGGAPLDIAVGAGTVWVAVSAPASVIRIPLS
jgi:virginiamycin B lyase